MRKIERTDEDIDRLEAWAMRAYETGESRYPGMSYEDGVRETLDWLFGGTNDSPADD